ncbi:MAG: BlaI/MecI/CopY family transcriptional regulator [Propionibacteriaceae bacterium]|nr:BlaI/MecI/CopY family transcriptional regulator [Propionibacteriaceae bacterium]
MALLGELENVVMGILWAHPGPLAVREVHARVGIERKLAYTTVMTVLDRLSKKGVVRRNLEGRAWLYTPATSRVDLIVSEIEELVRDLPTRERAEVARRLRVTFEAGAPVA